jgi:hypothetical protein
MFIDRDTNGKITGLYGCAQFPEQEQLADNDPQIAAYQQAIADPVPAQVTAGQLIRALDKLGLLAAVDAAVALADPLTQRLWARAPIFPRNDPLVLAVAQGLGKTPADIDNIFQLAASL